MRQDVANAAVRRAPRVPAHAACGRLCPILAFGRACKENGHRNCARVARICAALYSLAASVLAQFRLAEETSMVRRGIAALPAQAYRRNAIALIFLALYACAPELAPRGPGNDAPAAEDGAFITRDGLRLPLRHWDAAKPRAIIVALHGMSDYSQAFDLPGPWWAEHGISVYAYDQRGFGAAPNAGLWPGTFSLCADLDDFVEAARAKFPRIPIYALGESMGGSGVLAAMASARPPRVDGVILVAPAVWSRNDMPASYRAALWFAARTLPW